MIGQIFNRLKVIREERKDNYRQKLWLCECSCGNTTLTTTNKLKSGHTKSCGCLQKERAAETQFKHGYCYTKTYNSWRGMVERCINPKNKAYKWYGGKGVTVCDEWLIFENFLKDMGERPEGMSIERKDFRLNYNKINCCWLPIKKQNQNTRASVIVEYNGEKNCIAEWARKFNIPYNTLQQRLKKGMSIEKAAYII